MEQEKSKYSAFGKLVKKRLIDYDMTISQLAERLDTTPQYVNRILTGDRSGKKYIQGIKEILNISDNE